MGKKRPYISYQELEKYIGKENMIRFYEIMKDIFESYDFEKKEKKIKIYFLDYTTYLKYDERFYYNKDVPETYYYLCELEQILDSDLFSDTLEKFRGTRLSVSYTHVRNMLACNEVDKLGDIKDVAQKYGITVTNLYKIRKRYKN